jgi:group II intron reverse transcriptase/maturase
MAQECDYLESEKQLRLTLDKMYDQTKQQIAANKLPKFTGLLELITSEPTILTAIHNIKSNKGSNTPGGDGETMRPQYLHANYPRIVAKIRQTILDYHPNPVRRVEIPKPGKTEKRPLGIPAMLDRIVQECVRIIIEPILEAQFFKHSYGFRPMRDATHAIARIDHIIHITQNHWVVEGDIRRFFDSVNHTVLLKKLWHMGIRDRRVLCIIAQMLRAGIMKETAVNELGVPQGGLISPLLANVCLHTLDEWVTREWENKKTRRQYSRQDSKIAALRRSSNLKPAYFVRYADDWVLMTSSKENAEKWKQRIAKYLERNLKIQLSDEKTKITNIRKKAIKFLGIEVKQVRGKSKSGYITRSRPNHERLKPKIDKLRLQVTKLKHAPNKEAAIRQIGEINAITRGLIQYYQMATFVNIELSPFAFTILKAAKKALKQFGAKWVEANKTVNLIRIHKDYTTKIPAIKYEEKFIGLTSLSFCKWKLAKQKNDAETIYTTDGRNLHLERTGKARRLPRDDILLKQHAEKVAENELNNLEYFLNRGYALNRDRKRCRVCRKPISDENVHFHRVNPKLPVDKVNRVPNLATVHWECHERIHDGQDHANLGKKVWSKILRFREKLQ